MRRSDPRPLAPALARASARAAPATPLARVQGAWAGAVGEAIAREAQPRAERAGIVTVACGSAGWAAELELLAPRLTERLNEALGSPGEAPAVAALRFVVSSAP